MHNFTFESDSKGESNESENISSSTFRYGLDPGVGVRLNNAIGFTLGAEFEQSINKEYLYRFNGGVALSFIYLWPHLSEMTKDFFLIFEFKMAEVTFKDSGDLGLEREKETIFMLGSAVAF